MGLQLILTARVQSIHSVFKYELFACSAGNFMQRSCDDPLAYLLTWTTYGTWLPGDERGWTKRKSGPQLPDSNKERAALARMKHPVCRLCPAERQLVEAAIRAQCEKRGWDLLAVSCRSNHVHVVVSADDHPNRVRDQLKAACTRALKAGDTSCAAPSRWWTQGGSGRYVNDEDSLEAAILYVRDAQ